MVDTPKLQLKIIKMERFLLEKLTGFKQEISYRLWNPGFISIVTVPYPGPQMHPDNGTK
jgi:hypothetical protein